MPASVTIQYYQRVAEMTPLRFGLLAYVLLMIALCAAGVALALGDPIMFAEIGERS
jgi:hypothetical protein